MNIFINKKFVPTVSAGPNGSQEFTKKYHVDLSNGYDSNTWYPVRLKINANLRTFDPRTEFMQKLKVLAPLGMYPAPWGEYHNNSFYADLEASFFVSGWGVRADNSRNGFIWDNDFNKVKDAKNPIIINNPINANGAAIYLRGGTQYDLYSNMAFDQIDIVTEAATENGETFKPQSDVPESDPNLINFDTLKSQIGGGKAQLQALLRCFCKGGGVV